MKCRKALVSEEELLETKSAKRVASETHEQTLHRQNKHKYLSSSLRRRFCTSVLFIVVAVQA